MFQLTSLQNLGKELHEIVLFGFSISALAYETGKNMITSEKFLSAWREAASERSDALLSNWHSNSLYTGVILNNNDCLLDAVAEKVNLNSYPRDYYHLDGLLYSDNDVVPYKPENQCWVRSLSVAFEHENNFNRDIYREIAHLLILRSKLSVLVSYAQDPDPELMNYFHSIICGVPHAEELNEKESFLMILGRKDPLEWSGFVFKHDGWKRI